MSTMPAYVTLVTNRDKVVHYLDHDPRASHLLASRKANIGECAAYAQAVRDCLPDLSRGLEDDVGEAVRAVMRARLPRVSKRVRRARGVA